MKLGIKNVDNVDNLVYKSIFSRETTFLNVDKYVCCPLAMCMNFVDKSKNCAF